MIPTSLRNTEEWTIDKCKMGASKKHDGDKEASNNVCSVILSILNSNTKGHKEHFQGDINVLYLDLGGNYIAVFICQTQGTMHIKWMHFIVCKL